MEVVHPWPEVDSDEDRQVIELMEELLETTEQTPEELRARAAELRDEAQQTKIRGYRNAALVLADRYEQVATTRLSAR